MPTINENKFKIGLTNVDFDNTYSNVLHFKDRQEQEEYFSTNTLFVNKELVNIPIGNYFLQRVVINAGDSVDYSDLMNFNYAIIEDTNVNAKLHYWYYFIRKPQYTADKQIICDMELDIFNTYYIDVHFQDCLIRKAHLNRWVEDSVDNTLVKFDCSVNSNLFVQEDIKPQAKYLKERKEFALCGNSIDIANDGVIEFLDENVLGWLYLAIDENWNVNTGSSIVGSYGFVPHNEIVENINEYNDVKMKMPYSICCFPITKKDIQIKYNNNTYNWGADSFNAWKDDLAPFILDAFVSQEPPFINFKIVGDNIQQIYVDNNNNLIVDFISNDYLNYRIHLKGNNPLISCGDHISYITNKMHERTFILSNNYIFSKSAIINNTHNINYI